MSIMSSINSVNFGNTYAYRQQNPAVKTSAEKDAKDAKTIKTVQSLYAVEENEQGFTVKKTYDFADNGIYTRNSNRSENALKQYNLDNVSKTSEEITSMLRRQTEGLIKMVLDSIQTQGRYSNYNALQPDRLEALENAILGLKDHLMNGGAISPADQAQAAAAIADGGMWGAEAVSDRLIEAALKISGGDESKYKMMKSAIEAGFKSAEALWGGELPELSYKTFELTMTKLDKAFNQVKTEASEPAEPSELPELSESTVESA